MVKIDIEESRLSRNMGFTAYNNATMDASIVRSTINGATRVTGSSESSAKLFIDSSTLVNTDSLHAGYEEVLQAYEYATVGNVALESYNEYATVTAVNVTISGYEYGIRSRNEADSFTNMLLVNNGIDVDVVANTDSISHSLISDGGFPGVVALNNNISGEPLLDEELSYLPGSIGIDTGSSNASGIGELDVNGMPRLQDGDGDGISQIDMGASEFTGVPDDTIEESDSGNINASNPTGVNSWISGFNATFEYEVQESDTNGGTLEQWRLEAETGSEFHISNAWLSGGYNGGIQTFHEADTFVLSNENESFVDPLSAGDIVTFTIQGNGAGFAEGDLKLNFIALTNRPAATGECANPVAVSLPFSFDGQGEFCWEISDSIDYVNSWNTGSVTINSEDYSNQWSNTLPEKVDGKHTVLYNGRFPWSHFEAVGSY